MRYLSVVEKIALHVSWLKPCDTSMFRTVLCLSDQLTQQIIYPQPKVQVSGIDESRSTEKAAGGGGGNQTRTETKIKQNYNPLLAAQI